MSMYEQRLSRFDQPQITTPSGNNRLSYQDNNSESQIRLPKIELPSFLTLMKIGIRFIIHLISSFTLMTA